MTNAPIIDLSLRAPGQMIADRGAFAGCVHIVWFRLLRPALVGAVWASICIYTYRYLLPFNDAEMPIEQLVFYVTCIAVMAGALVTWLIAARVVHPFAYRRAGFLPKGHLGKSLVTVLETYPRDELFQADEDQLYDIALGVLRLQEHQRTRLFVRRDRFDRFVSCLVR